MLNNTSDVPEDTLANCIGELFEDAGILVPHLEPLNKKILSELVSRNLYNITYANIAIAIGNMATVALDVIRGINKTVYGYVLEHLSIYLDAVNGVSKTVDMSNNFIIVIEDVLKQDIDNLSEVIDRSSDQCVIADISNVSETAWPALAKYRRFPSTFSNVIQYVKAMKLVDEYLAKVLIAAGEISEIDAADEEPKTELAFKILAAREQIPSARQRMKLVASLNLKEYLSVDEIAIEDGDLFHLLLKYNIIADEETSYEHLAMTDWPTRKAFIHESKKFSSYMTPELVQPILEELLKTDEIDSEIKSEIVENASEYAKVAGPQGLTEFAQFAIKHGHKLPIEVIHKMVQGNVASQQIVLLLETHLTSIRSDQLLTILNELEGDYPKLMAVGKDKPRIPNISADRALLDRLKEAGIVSSYKESKSLIVVNKKHK